MKTPMPHTPNPLYAANQAQQMAKHAGNDRIGVAFQYVALVSMAAVGLASVTTMLLQLLGRNERGRGRD